MIIVEYGFKDIYGIEWSNGQVDSYNSISKQIDDREKGGFPVSETLLDQRHASYQVPFYGRMREKKEVFAKKMDKRIKELER